MHVPNYKERCVVPGCETVAGVRLHNFPTNINVQKKWVEMIPNLASAFPYKKLEDMMPMTLKNYKVCTKHFETTQYFTVERKKLLIGAVPTIFSFKGTETLFFYSFLLHQ